MRFKIQFESLNSFSEIPINYQYPLSSWIYKTFANSDSYFSNWLHQHGYAFNGNRKFKLFTFSNLFLEKSSFVKESKSLKIHGKQHYFYLSFCMEEAAEHFIKGIFRQQEFDIADSIHKARFTIKSVERVKEPEFRNKLPYKFQCLSPINLSIPKVENEKMRADYIDPEHERYSEILLGNLLRKFATAKNRIVMAHEAHNRMEAFADLPESVEWQLKILSRPKSKLITIKEGKRDQSQVRGHLFRFTLQADPDLLRFAWQAGLGEKTSLGFGCIEILEK